MGPTVLLLEGTEFILVKGLVPTTGVEIETTEQIMAHTTVMTMTGTIQVMTDIMIIDIMTSTEANIMTGVMIGDMTTEVGTGLHVGVLFILDLTTTIQAT